MSQDSAPATGPKPKKSVALSGVTAGNTALCTVGRSGNDLHYRGYDILDIADAAQFEEIAYLLVHGKLPNQAELTAYKTNLRAMRGIPANVKTVLEALPARSTGLVFASRVVPLKPYSIEGRWAEALKAAKIRGFRFHDLRHSCASFLAQNGATLLEIGDLLGHRQISMTKRYSHLASAHRAALVNRVLGSMK